MKVFISWSGQRSLYIAKALYEWLPETVQFVKPWMSHVDIQAGAKWSPEINNQLSQTKFGIICLTPENQHKPWLAFEAGALAKTVDDAYVVPYLIDMDKSEVEGPLAQFQAVSLDEKGTFGLVQSINRVPNNDAALQKERLEKVFNRGWPELKRVFENLPDADAPIQKPRDTDEILREVLELVRDLSRRAKRSYPGYGIMSEEEIRARTLEQKMQVQDAYEAAKEADEAAKYLLQDAYEAIEDAEDAHEAAKYQEQD